MERMIQCGIRLMTSIQYLLELQRNWAHVGTYKIVKGVVAICGKRRRGVRQAGSHETALQFFLPMLMKQDRLSISAVLTEKKQ